MKATGFDLVFQPQPTIYPLWALGDDETRKVIEAAHERAIERVLEWIEDEVAVIRYGRDGIYRDRPPGGLVAARFRRYEARSGMPLLHEHLMLSVKGQRLDGKWGSAHSEALFENTVAASALYNETVAAEVCEALGPATEPRIVTAGRRPVMEKAGVPHELIRWTASRGEQIAACLEDLEHEYVTAVDDDGNLKFAPEVSEQARAKLNQIAAKVTRPPKQQARPLAQLRERWKASAVLSSGVAVDVINSLLEHARAAAAAIRARVTAVVAVAPGGRRRHRDGVRDEQGRLLPPPTLARRSPPSPRSRPARPPPRTDPGRKDRGRRHCRALPGHQRAEDAARPHAGPPLLHRPLVPGRPARLPPSTGRRTPNRIRATGPRPAPGTWDPPCLPLEPGEWDIPRVPLLYDRAVIASTVLTDRPRATRRTGRALYDDIVAHQQAAMLEQLLIPVPDTDAEPRSPLDMTALRALKEPRTDVEALDLTAERLRHLQDAFTAAADRARATMDRYADRENTDGPHPVREDDQQAHRPQQPGPHRGREAGH
ncbi:MobF family relaxase [Streptomyces sp. NPDC056930]|uniref:MobF family relaxase n=1 Tax=Streptomyces sp. NPDC056930 TaxID=3345967 RepID=UPI00363BC958